MSEFDPFDRAIGSLDGVPDVIHSAPTTIRAVTPMVGHATTFIVQTYRQRDTQDEDAKSAFTVFLEHVSESGTTRIVIPPAVSDLIARQRDALITRARSRSAKATAQDRKARGLLPGFMKHKKK